MSFTLGERHSHNQEQLFEKVRDNFSEICRGVCAIHNHRVIIRDLTKTNILIDQTQRTPQVRFMDFEFAYEADLSEDVTPGYTAGYASPQQ